MGLEQCITNYFAYSQSAHRPPSWSDWDATCRQQRTPRAFAAAPARSRLSSLRRGPFRHLTLLQKSKGASSMAFLVGFPQAPVPPSGRYTRTKPLRREHGLRLLTASLPEPLRCILLCAWRRPGQYWSVDQDWPHPYRQRPDDAFLLSKPPRTLGYLAVVELELARRLVEAPQASIWPTVRNTMPKEQGMY